MSVIIALRAKMKLGFIDRKYAIPDKVSDNYETWIQVDSMVTSWILNTMTKRVSKAFLYTKSSKQLWLDLEEMYGENNGSLVYQLCCAIALITQGTSNVIEYFNNLTALWDELECLMPTKTCTCGLCTRGFTKIMDEEANLTKAYSMVLRVERQRLVNMQTNDSNAGNSVDDLDKVKRYLDDLFTIKDLGHAKYFLGLELARSSHGTYISQRVKYDSESSPLLPSSDRYRRLIGRLLYIGFSRPDISNLAFLTKHLDIDCHLVHDHFKRGFILPRHIPSAQQVADLFTKGLPAALFSRLLSKLGMLSDAPT
ncbi:Copia protein [Sesamum angolense]|uniref:Copia protein n=1 Tax=Sesamum angolense TaxID=2727404 RepID=A0AAE2C5R2_9LAMI|nr:Copia protein [Sesamum angolense]